MSRLLLAWFFLGYVMSTTGPVSVTLHGPFENYYACRAAETSYVKQPMRSTPGCFDEYGS